MPASTCKPKVPLLDLVAANEEIEAELQQAWQKTLHAGQYILGPNVRAFEEEFARWNGSSYSIGVASGTDALVLALEAVGVRAGDEVITVANTAVATVNAICQVGARPVFADVRPDTWLMDPEDVARKITGKTKAIVPVHLYGNPCNMTELCALGEQARVPIVEDCCQAHGATLNERRVGNWGQAGAFSFYPTKNLGALGDGGLVVTNDPALAEHVRRGRFYGFDEARISHQLGRNSRLDELQAAILSVKLRRLDQWTQQRHHWAEIYARELASVVSCQAVTPGGHHVYHLFVIALERREEVRRALSRVKVETMLHYPIPVYQHPAYRQYACALPVTEWIVARNVSVPLYPQLTMEQVEHVISALKEAVLE